MNKGDIMNLTQFDALGISKATTIAFTGNRKIKEAYYHEYIVEHLTSLIRKAVSKGFVNFVNGGAVGGDYMEAVAVIRGGGNLWIFRPFPSQANMWPESTKKAWNAVYLKAKGIIDVNDDPYTAEKMMSRNRAMIDRSCWLLALHDGRNKGGALNSINYAKEHKVPALIYNPISGLETRQ